MKPPCCCSGVTGTSPAATVTPVENKTQNETARKEQIPPGRRMCVGCRHTLDSCSELERRTCTEEINFSFCFLCFARFSCSLLTRGVICKENSLGSVLEIINLG